MRIILLQKHKSLYNISYIHVLTDNFIVIFVIEIILLFANFIVMCVSNLIVFTFFVWDEIVHYYCSIFSQ